MGVITSMCVLWGCLALLDFSFGCDHEGTKALQAGNAEPRGRHRLQLLFPLLLRISTRLATLVPTALLGLLGIMLFVVFSKKALIVSLLALFLTISGKHNAKHDDIYIHKVESYPEYNDEEHIHYHHGPTVYKKQYNGGNKKWKKHLKRTTPFHPFHRFDDNIKPFKPLADKRVEEIVFFPNQNSPSVPGEWNSTKRQFKLGHE